VKPTQVRFMTSQVAALRAEVEAFAGVLAAIQPQVHPLREGPLAGMQTWYEAHQGRYKILTEGETVYLDFARDWWAMTPVQARELARSLIGAASSVGALAAPVVSAPSTRDVGEQR
jgi:hypothetical protein